ncbi:hypothetical protein GLOTRDRAFT_129462 [Gloeophyllum trabeum ATCC 11539]|uniref:Uncharacterized protein n=1 Tax=Gloeophyllum trabeum (strain ATCC 11539 / FP-39264 / Madison 617) TaxID=670483 RepID=S7Q6M5_GLOTA|nr:uncharacterized protein GLOTRDRAFT_129462 [Gloeophyllum trabeum ATCC 11539]EPQ55172.1 hypothetical protein GLOTRDRAFT_129462 [Gloeophyllum trabeum ATCC 11539]
MAPVAVPAASASSLAVFKVPALKIVVGVGISMGVAGLAAGTIVALRYYDKKAKERAQLELPRPVVSVTTEVERVSDAQVEEKMAVPGAFYEEKMAVPGAFYEDQDNPHVEKDIVDECRGHQEGVWKTLDEGPITIHTAYTDAHCGDDDIFEEIDIADGDTVTKNFIPGAWIPDDDTSTHYRPMVPFNITIEEPHDKSGGGAEHAMGEAGLNAPSDDVYDGVEDADRTVVEHTIQVSDPAPAEQVEGKGVLTVAMVEEWLEATKDWTPPEAVMNASNNTTVVEDQLPIFTATPNSVVLTPKEEAPALQAEANGILTVAMVDEWLARTRDMEWAPPTKELSLSNTPTNVSITTTTTTLDAELEEDITKVFGPLLPLDHVIRQLLNGEHPATMRRRRVGRQHYPLETRRLLTEAPEPERVTLSPAAMRCALRAVCKDHGFEVPAVKVKKMGDRASVTLRLERGGHARQRSSVTITAMATVDEGNTVRAVITDATVETVEDNTTARIEPVAEDGLVIEASQELVAVPAADAGQVGSCEQVDEDDGDEQSQEDKDEWDSEEEERELKRHRRRMWVMKEAPGKAMLAVEKGEGSGMNEDGEDTDAKQDERSEDDEGAEERRNRRKVWVMKESSEDVAVKPVDGKESEDVMREKDAALDEKPESNSLVVEKEGHVPLSGVSDVLTSALDRGMPAPANGELVVARSLSSPLAEGEAVLCGQVDQDTPVDAATMTGEFVVAGCMGDLSPGYGRYVGAPVSPPTSKVVVLNALESRAVSRLPTPNVNKLKGSRASISSARRSSLLPSGGSGSPAVSSLPTARGRRKASIGSPPAGSTAARARKQASISQSDSPSPMSYVRAGEQSSTSGSSDSTRKAVNSRAPRPPVSRLVPPSSPSVSFGNGKVRWDTKTLSVSRTVVPTSPPVSSSNGKHRQDLSTPSVSRLVAPSSPPISFGTGKLRQHSRMSSSTSSLTSRSIESSVAAAASMKRTPAKRQVPPPLPVSTRFVKSGLSTSTGMFSSGCATPTSPVLSGIPTGSGRRKPSMDVRAGSGSLIGSRRRPNGSGEPFKSSLPSSTKRRPLRDSRDLDIGEALPDDLEDSVSTLKLPWASPSIPATPLMDITNTVKPKHIMNRGSPRPSAVPVLSSRKAGLTRPNSMSPDLSRQELPPTAPLTFAKRSAFGRSVASSSQASGTPCFKPHCRHDTSACSSRFGPSTIGRASRAGPSRQHDVLNAASARPPSSIVARPAVAVGSAVSRTRSSTPSEQGGRSAQASPIGRSTTLPRRDFWVP